MMKRKSRLRNEFNTSFVRRKKSGANSLNCAENNRLRSVIHGARWTAATGLWKDWHAIRPNMCRAGPVDPATDQRRADLCCPLRYPGMKKRRIDRSNRRLLPTAAQPQNGGACVGRFESDPATTCHYREAGIEACLKRDRPKIIFRREGVSLSWII
jgi:hypothetical protein